MHLLKRSGYLKSCCHCGNQIYMKHDHDDRWRPYRSWLNGDCDEGEWIIHSCAGQQAGTSSGWQRADGPTLPPVGVFS